MGIAVKTTHEPTQTERRATGAAWEKATARHATMIAVDLGTGARLGVVHAIRAPGGTWTAIVRWNSPTANTHGRAGQLGDALAAALTRGGFEGFPRPTAHHLRGNADTFAACVAAEFEDIPPSRIAIVSDE